MSVRAVGILAAVAVFSVVSVEALLRVERFASIGPEHLAPTASLASWTVEGDGCTATIDGDALVATCDPGGRIELGQLIPVGDAHMMRLAGDLTWRDVGKDGLAEVRHCAVTAAGEVTDSFPCDLAVGAGDSGWHRAAHGFLVDPIAASLAVTVMLEAPGDRSATIAARGLSLRDAEVSTAWLGLVAVILAVWAVGGGVAGVLIVRAADRKWAAALAIAGAAVCLPLLLTPQAAFVVGARAIAGRDEEPSAQRSEEPSLGRRAIGAMLDGVDDDDVHVWLFIGIGWAATWARRRPDVAIGLALVDYAVASEAIQTISLDRGAAIGDVGLDCLGAGIGMATAGLGGAWRPVRSDEPSVAATQTPPLSGSARDS